MKQRKVNIFPKWILEQYEFKIVELQFERKNRRGKYYLNQFNNYNFVTITKIK